MIKLSKLTDYAVVILAQMTQEKGALLSASTLSGRTGLPEPTVSKILKSLGKSGIIDSVRGASGGYRIDKTAENVPVAAIIAAMEGPIALTACVENSEEICALQGICAMNGRWNPVNKALRSALDNVTLADMTGANAA